MAIAFHFSWVVALVLCSLCTKVVYSAPEVHFINNFSNKSTIVDALCKVNGTTLVIRTIETGDDSIWFATVNDIYRCTAQWEVENFTASWPGYEPKRDAGRAKIFWRINEGGFFLSYDKSSFKLEATWKRAG